jgi:hypothetical protein
MRDVSIVLFLCGSILDRKPRPFRVEPRNWDEQAWETQRLDVSWQADTGRGAAVP